MNVLALSAFAFFLTAAFLFFFATPFYWRRAGRKAVERGDFAAATTAYSKALKISPRDAALWRLKGLAARRIGDVDAALEALRKAGELAPDQTETIAERADIFRSLGRFEEALEETNRIVEASANPTTALLTRSSILLDLRRFADAEADCDRVVEKADVDSVCAGALNNRGVARLGLGRDDDAASDFETAYLLDPRLSTAQAHCAGNWLRRGEPEKARRLCDAILAAAPKCAVAFRYRGLAKRTLGDESGATADLAKADELEGDLFERSKRNR